MKEWNIEKIQNITEGEAMLLTCGKKTVLKEHNIYFVDFGKPFGFSMLVFKNSHHIYYANDYELHNSYFMENNGKEALKERYIGLANMRLYTDKELEEPIKDYEEYQRKSYYLHNYYAMREDYVTIFAINPSAEETRKFREKVKGMSYDPVGFCYIKSKSFVKRHIELNNMLEKRVEELRENFEYYKNAFLYEMYNHEYSINWQADYDTLSAFGNIEYHDDNLDAYFKELGFTDTQKRAYKAAQKEYWDKESA